MIVVKIELWPLGDKAKATEIGRMVITNDAAGGRAHGNYDVILTHAPSYMPSKNVLKLDPTKAVWKTGRVEGHARKLSPYHLLLRALRACGITSIKREAE